MSKPQYVRDTLNAPRITRFGHEVVQVAHIEIGKHRAADIYRDVELPSGLNARGLSVRASRV